MFEKPKNFKLDVPKEFIERSRKNQIEAVKRGDSWPTPEGAVDEEIAKAFEYYLGTASSTELNDLSIQIKEVGDEWTTEKSSIISKELDQVYSKTGAARHLASLTAVLTFIPLGLVSAIGVKVALNTLITTVEKLALTGTEEKIVSWTEIRNHLEQLQDLTKEEESTRKDSDWTEFKEAA